MPERKVWTAEQDRALKYLVQQRGITKWADLPDILEQQFQIAGRNGKQCRDRYHNHLAEHINSSSWSKQEEDKLFELQGQLGNKWALISTHLPGRTDNTVKNHFYSKLRKALRKLNKKINKYLRREFKDVKTTILYRVIETIQTKSRTGQTKNKLLQSKSKTKEEIQQAIQNMIIDSAQQKIEVQEKSLVDVCFRIKEKLRYYEQAEYESLAEQMKEVRIIVEDFVLIDETIKKSPRKQPANSKNGQRLIQSERRIKTETALQASVSGEICSSINEEDSQSLSNYSDLYSSGQLTLSASRSNGSKTRSNASLFHSVQGIESEDEQDSIEEKQQEKKSKRLNKSDYLLHRTDYVLKKSQNALKLPLMRSHHKSAVIQPQPKQQSQGSISSSNSVKDQHMYMFGQESIEITVVLPRDLTIQEKMELQNEMCQMKLQQDLVNDFAGMAMARIPQLKQDLDWE